MKDLIRCPICLEIFNHLTHVPCLNQCGTICCKTCLMNVCVFCAQIHQKPAQEFVPFKETLREVVVLCVNRDRTAEFIETQSFLPYCRNCKGEKLGISMENDLFQNLLDDRLLQLSQLIDQQLFVHIHRKIQGKNNAAAKLKLIRVLMQFVSSSAFCFKHPKLKAIAIDKDLKFRCGFCDETDVVFLNNADECKHLARKFMKNHSLRMEKEINEMIFDGICSVVQIFIEIHYFVKSGDFSSNMLGNRRNHNRSLTKEYQDHSFKLPLIKKRCSLDFSSLPRSHQEISEGPERGFQSLDHKLEKFTENTSSGAFSLDIPKLAYSAFKKKPKGFSQPRRSSDFAVASTDFQFNKIQLPEPRLQNQQSLMKDSIVNKKTFKRIDLGQIDMYSKNFGQKLIRVQELVLDPLMADSDLSNDG